MDFTQAANTVRLLLPLIPMLVEKGKLSVITDDIDTLLAYSSYSAMFNDKTSLFRGLSQLINKNRETKDGSTILAAINKTLSTLLEIADTADDKAKVIAFIGSILGVSATPSMPVAATRTPTLETE